MGKDLGSAWTRAVAFALLALTIPFVDAIAALADTPAVPRVISAAGQWTLVGWNNLGMHCMDGDYAVLSLLPPYNTIHAQLIDPTGHLVKDTAGITLTYEAVADPDGSVNRTSAGKTNFWQYAQILYGAAMLPTDVGLIFGKAMPGAANVPQPMDFSAGMAWFTAEGIPITPIDDDGNRNAYPLMRIAARDGAGTVLATTDIVLPVSSEMDCKSCHLSTSGPAARPESGWAQDPDPERDVRLNILLLHDEKQAGDPAYAAALATGGYSSAGLYASVVGDGQAILCAKCHLSEALPGTGMSGIPPLTQAIHGRHADVIDPKSGLALDALANRGACYTCHPGSTTRCLRGAMGASVAPDGTMAMQCQSCHGSMKTVAAPTRTGWLDEPTCQSCHTGTATSNSGQIRYTSVFTATGQERVPANRTFATNENAPAPGLSLYRFSSGHGGLKCEACHGSTHAEYPSSHRNDNIQSTTLQGHAGTLVECASCHGTTPLSVSGGPHGMHPVGQAFVSSHGDVAEQLGTASCRNCHGTDYRGTVLSRSQANRVLNTGFGSKSFWRGFQIGCYNCHRGPSSDDANPNRAPVVTSAMASTASGTPVMVALAASDADGNPLTLRVVSQSANGTVGLTGTKATYYPDPGFTGNDAFTFAAWDGSTNSNLGTISLKVAQAPCTVSIAPASQTFGPAATTGGVQVTAGAECAWTAVSNASWLNITSGAGGSGGGAVAFDVAANLGPSTRTGTLTIGGNPFTATQTGSTAVDLTGSWKTLAQICKGSGPSLQCQIKGSFTLRNVGTVPSTSSVLRFTLSADAVPDAGDTLLKNVNVGKVVPGKPLSISLGVKFPIGTSGSGKRVLGIADATGVVSETHEDNNVAPSAPLP